MFASGCDEIINLRFTKNKLMTFVRLHLIEYDLVLSQIEVLRQHIVELQQKNKAAVGESSKAVSLSSFFFLSSKSFIYILFKKKTFKSVVLSIGTCMQNYTIKN